MAPFGELLFHLNPLAEGRSPNRKQRLRGVARVGARWGISLIIWYESPFARRCSRDCSILAIASRESPHATTRSCGPSVPLHSTTALRSEYHSKKLRDADGTVLSVIAWRLGVSHSTSKRRRGFFAWERRRRYRVEVICLELISGTRSTAEAEAELDSLNRVRASGALARTALSGCWRCAWTLVTTR